MNASAVLFRIIVTVVFGTASTSCSSGRSSERTEVEIGQPVLKPTGEVQKGKASWYSIRTNRGTRTASGQPLRNNAATAAHRYWPMGTMVKVTNLTNGRSQIVKITDRGPYTRGRIIDVTIGIAERLGMVDAGVVPCTIERLELSH